MARVVTSGGATGAPSASTLRRRRLAPDDRRAELIDAAIGVLRAGVDEGNWVAEVTRAAGAAKGTFYLYFPSWEDMLGVVRERLIDECNAPIRDALAAPERVDWWAVLEDQCGRFVDVVAEFGRHHALIFHAALPRDPGGASRSGPALLAAAIERGMAEGCFGPVDVEAAAQLLFAAVHAAADAVLAGGERERWIATCTALARRYLAPQSPRMIPQGQPALETRPA
ncbi:MAG: TetR/AcrR family transcriptional regulator [Candidatus Limnocylindrales bacterium]